MKTIYATTRASWYDTIAISKGKWLQQLNDPSSAPAGLLAEPDNTDVRFNDSKLMILQKIGTRLQTPVGSEPRAILDDSGNAILDDDGKAILE